MDVPCNHATDDFGICTYRCDATLKALLPLQPAKLPCPPRSQNCSHPNGLFVLCTFRCNDNTAYRAAVAAASPPACVGTHISGQVARDCVGGILGHTCDDCYDWVMLAERR